jgi:FKBP-type peptidyl-prolyl cis-trans isomerase
VLISSVPANSQAYSQNGKSASATKKRRKHRKRMTVSSTASSPVNTTPSGLIYVITRHGEGRQPKKGETVIVHYTGLLTSGMKFDSSLDRGAPFSFELGAGRVIAGWDEGIAKLHVGDQATLIIPSTLGYGAKGTGPIPADATLVFIVELVGIKETPAVN